MLAYVINAIYSGLKNHTPWAWSLMMSYWGIGALFSFVQIIIIRRKINKFTDAKSIGARFGIDAIALQTFAEEQGIKPRYNINGEDFYDLKDFGDAATLLRASVAPVSEPHTLLRPAANNRAETPPAHLLRPSNTPETQTLTNGRTETP